MNDNNTQFTPNEIDNECCSSNEGCETCNSFKSQIDGLQESNLRLLADCDNLRKRHEIEINSLKKTANNKLLQKIVDISDDINRALDYVMSTGNIDDSKQGIAQIIEKFSSLLISQGVTSMGIRPGDLFDPSCMDALGTMPLVENSVPNTVAIVVEQGYIFVQDHSLLRSAKVMVYQ